MLIKLHHVGIESENLENSIEQYKLLGYFLNERFNMPEHSIKGAMLSSPDKEVMLELIECKNPSSELGIKAKNHFAFLSDDIDQDIKSMIDAGFMISYPKVTSQEEVFIYLEDINKNQIELIQYLEGGI
jgi:Glyoxalase/Bleomycin resistance protein/Dioxygenase superfamily